MLRVHIVRQVKQLVINAKKVINAPEVQTEPLVTADKLLQPQDAVRAQSVSAVNMHLLPELNRLVRLVLQENIPQKVLRHVLHRQKDMEFRAPNVKGLSALIVMAARHAHVEVQVQVASVPG